MALHDEFMSPDNGSMTTRSSLRLIDNDDRTTDRTQSLVEVFADVRCPFAHVGLRRFMQRRHDEGRDDVGLWVRAWPLEIVNDAPLDPATVARGVDALRRGVAPELFAGFNIDTFARTSLPALRLAAAAYQDGIESGERVSWRCATPSSSTARTSPNPMSWATSHGGAASAPGRAASAPSSPTGVTGASAASSGRHTSTPTAANWFCPALHVGHDDERLDVALDRNGFNEFTQRCFSAPPTDVERAG